MLPTFIISIIAVGLMMLGLSITLIRKGRNMQTDVGDNDDMKALGLKCTVEEMSGTGQGCQLPDGGCCTHCDVECGVKH